MHRVLFFETKRWMSSRRLIDPTFQVCRGSLEGYGRNLGFEPVSGPMVVLREPCDSSLKEACTSDDGVDVGERRDVAKENPPKPNEILDALLLFDHKDSLYAFESKADDFDARCLKRLPEHLKLDGVYVRLKYETAASIGMAGNKLKGLVMVEPNANPSLWLPFPLIKARYIAKYRYILRYWNEYHSFAVADEEH